MLARKNPAPLSRGHRASKRDSFGSDLSETLTETEIKVNNTDRYFTTAVRFDPLDFPILERHWGNLRGVPR